MGKKRKQPKFADHDSEKRRADVAVIDEAIAELNGLAAPEAAIAVLEDLKSYAGKKWLNVEVKEYAFADKLYKNRRWLTPEQDVLPPGTTFLGIVLEKALEVSVVEVLNDDREYHRPMTILPQGALFGTFETADLICETEPLQDYTVFSGLRTFSFYDPTLDSSIAVVRAKEAIEKIPKVVSTKLKNWWQSKKYSPTQTPLFLVEAVLGKDIENWKAKILLIEIGSEFLAHISVALKERIWRTAWRQSAHLRRQAIESYSTDRLIDILRGIRKKGSGISSVPDTHRFAIARELNTLPELLTESRPGFREIPADNASHFGPFQDFFSRLSSGKVPAAENEGNAQTSENISKSKARILVPSFLYDGTEELIFPLWPNCDPKCGKTHDHFGGPGVLDELRKPMSEEPKETKWKLIKKHLFTGESAYSSDLIKLDVPGSGKKERGVQAGESPSKKSGRSAVVCFLRGAVRMQTAPPILPLFGAVKREPELRGCFAALVGVQHLMVETLCLINEILDRELVEPQNIWILGKPYSSNERVLRRLQQLGVHAEIPSTVGWLPGHFDSEFRKSAELFLDKALSGLQDSDCIPVGLLDDGGALIQAANKRKWKAGYRAVEQTSGGIAAAMDADFPVVLVACSAVKCIVEPEFVARAAVNKIAKYYPEALRAKSVGIIGLGNLGNYLAGYISYRRDIHHGVSVYGYDRRTDLNLPLSPKVKHCENISEVFRQAEVVYGCSGEDIGFAAQEHGRSGQLLASLSSGDIEFASLLKNEQRIPGPVVAQHGFPITFDRSPSSASLIEMQVTRALLLVGLQQALSEKDPGPHALDAQAQWTIWTRWRDHALDNDTGDPSLKTWRDQRSAELKGADFGDLVARIGGEDTFVKRNTEFFDNAKKRFPARPLQQVGTRKMR
jgi:hypothetical protein